MKISKLLVLGTLVASLLMVPARPVSALDSAHSFDLTYRGAKDTVNGSIIYAFTPTDSTGTGFWHSFLRVSAANKSVVKGYNSDYKKKANVQFNEDAAWTESWRLEDVPRVEEDGVLYREFQLDINQNKSGTDALISVDQLQVWLTNERMHDEKVDPYIVTYPFDANPDFHFVWGLDEVDDNVILLNFHLNPGSGKRDFKILVPDDLFDDAYTYVVLYTEHGADAYTGDYDLDADLATTGDVVSVVNAVFGNNDGFEEWGVAVYPCTDLSIDKTATPGPICPGAEITYTLTVTNVSDEPAESANIVDTLPAGVTVTGVEVDGAPTVDYSVDVNNVLTYPATGGFSLDAGKSITLEIFATAPTGVCDETLVNSATVNVTTPQECDLTNNTDSASTIVQDITDPVITCPDDVTVECIEDVPAPDIGSASATDNCDPSPDITHEGDSSSGTCPTTITRTYRATDDCGNYAECTQTITVIDTIQPVLPTLPEGGDLGCNPTPPSCVDDLVATDNCDGEVPVICTPGAITGDCDKSQTFTYSATDECGNSVSDTVTYTWKVDTTDPV
ncbi:MAG: DUF11 domain-containing protein, partial [Planctomycetes bacterium]|nr:DUF11 domain-containing protein [Planctomycetota bacterium]